MRLIDSFELFTRDRFSVCKGIYCFLLLRSLSLDLETREKREWSIKGKRLVFSPSEEQVAILNWDVDKTIMLARLNFVNVETETETQVLRKFIKKDWGSPERLVWLKANLLVLSTEYTLGSFVFIDLKEGELK